MQGGTFFPYPLTERIAKMWFVPEEGHGPVSKIMMSVGLQCITEDGLKIVPFHAVVVALGPPGDAEALAFDLDPKTARDISKRMIEMANHAEGLNATEEAHAT